MATLLSAGDIAIVHYATTGVDEFSFVFLRDVEAGTTVNFTDNGWLAAGGFRSGEGSVTYTAATAITAGTIITLTGLDLDDAGDQIIAYQNDAADPDLLYAIDFADGDAAFAADATDTATSALPTGLAPGVTALALPFNNAAYAGPNSGSPLDLLEAIGDSTRWSGDDLTPQPRGADFLTFDRPTVDLDFDNSTHIGRDYETTVALGGPAVQIADADLRVTEGTGSFVTSATIRVIGPEFGDLLAVNGLLPFGIFASFYNPFTGVLTLSGVATPDAYETAIRQVEFSTTDGPIGATKRVQVTIFDGGASSFEANAFFHVSLVGQSAAAPLLDLDANNSNGGGADYTATYTAGGPGIPIADVDVSITDVDSTTLASATLTIISWSLQSGDTLSIAGSLPPGITASSFNPTTGVLTLSGTASLADYQTALRQVVYSSTNPAPPTNDRAIQVVVNDGGLNSNAGTTYMHVVAAPANTPPVLNLDADSSTTGGDDYLTTFTDGGPPVAIVDTDVLIIDSDSPTLASATITLTNPQTDDVLVFNGTPPTGISVSGSGTTAITLTGSASPAAYQTALQQITFNNTGTNPSSDTRAIDVVVNDGTADSNVATAIVEVVEVNNSAPVLDLDEDNSTAPGTAFRGTFTENGAPVPIADIDTLVTDIDSANLASATITLTNPHAGDLLTVSGRLPGGIEASAYDPVTGVLTLTTVSGPRSLADYQTALEQIRFSAGGDNPEAGTRIVEVVVNDGVNDGDTATSLITVAAVNDAPSITVDATATYVENDASVVLAPSAILGDLDNTDFTFALVEITEGSFAGDGEELAILGLTSGTLGTIAWEWDPAAHALVLTGTDAAGLYELLLQNVEFKSTSDNPTDYNASPTRTLSWTVSDGTTQTTTTSVLNVVARNDAPIATVAATASYIENNAAVTISPVATVADVDNIQLTAGQVTIVSGALAGDVLTVNGLESGTFAGISFFYDPGLHSLQFTFAAPLADYQTFLQAVQFHSTSDDPTNAGADLTRTLSWTLFDGKDVSVAQTTTLTVSAVNDPPVAQDGSASGNEDTPIAGTLVATDIDNVTLTYALAVDAAHGTVVVDPDGSYTYTPNTDFSGTDSFTFTANDGTVDSNSATVSLTVAALNDAPVNTVPVGLSVNEDTPLVIAGLSVTDVDSPTLTVVLTAASGTLIVTPGPVLLAGNLSGGVTITGTVADVNAALAGLRYLGNPDFNGVDTITIDTSDGTLNDTDNFQITVNAAGDAPQLDLDANNSSGATGANNIALFSEDGPPALLADTDLALADVDSPDLVGATFTLLNAQAGDILVVTGILPGGINAAFVGNELTLSGTASVADYTAALALIAFDNPGDAPDPQDRIIQVTVNDGALTTTAFALVHVQTTNDPPVAQDGSAGGNEDTPIGGTLVATDIDSATLTYALAVDAAHGTVVVNTDGSYTYTPNADFNGSDSFTFTANDGIAPSNIATVSLTVTAVNDLPVAQDGSASGGEDTPIGGTLIASDIDSATLTYGLAVDAAHGTVVVNTDGSYTYTPDPEFNGTDSFTFTASDGIAPSNIATVSLTVTAVNDPPVNTMPGAQTVNEDTTLAIAGVLVDDVDGGTLTATLTVANGVLTVTAGAGVSGNGTGTVTLTGTAAEINLALAGLTYLGSPDFNGPDALTVTTSDGTLSDVDTVAITVLPINDPPLAQNGSASGDEDTVIAGTLVATDVDSATLTYSLAAPAANGTVVVNPDGSFTYTPNADFNGTDSFTFTADDGTAGSNVATVLVTVNPVNDGPTGQGGGGNPLPPPNPDGGQGLSPGGAPNAASALIGFDAGFYLLSNPDVAQTGVDPLEHFNTFGWREGRDPNTWFDTSLYLANNPDVAAAGVNPLQHYEEFGGHEGRSPNAWFDAAGYLAHYSDVATAGVNPWQHYEEFGWREGRDPSAAFDTIGYLAAYPDVATAGVNPLEHFLQFGILEGRSPFGDGVWH